MPRTTTLILGFAAIALIALCANTFYTHTTKAPEVSYFGQVIVPEIPPTLLLKFSRNILTQHKITIPTIAIDSTIQSSIPGDVNHSGALEVVDFAIMIEVIMYSQYCDMNKDGKIDTLDIKYLEDYVWNKGPVPLNYTGLLK